MRRDWMRVAGPLLAILLVAACRGSLGLIALSAADGAAGEAGLEADGPRAEVNPADGPTGDSVAGLPDGPGAPDAPEPDAPSSRDAGADAGADAAETAEEPPNPACQPGAMLTERQLLLEDFERYPPGPVTTANGSAWVEVELGRQAHVTEGGAHGGRKALTVSSFTTKVETVYVPLASTGPLARVVVTGWLTPDPFTVYYDFGEVGLGRTRSKFDLQRLISVRASNHQLLLRQGSDSGGDLAWDELEYAPPPVHTQVILDVDLCKGEVTVSAGRTAPVPVRKKISIARIPVPNALFLRGGLNPTDLDDLEVRGFGP